MVETSDQLVKPIPSCPKTRRGNADELWDVGKQWDRKKKKNPNKRTKNKKKTVAIMAMIMNTTKKARTSVKKRKWNKRVGGGEEKLLFLLTRFIRKENLDKRGCKITEIVERHKIKADPIFWDQFISGMNCVLLFCWFFKICSIHEHLNLVTLGRHDRQWHYIKEKKKGNGEPMRSQRFSKSVKNCVCAIGGSSKNGINEMNRWSPGYLVIYSMWGFRL